MLLSSKSETSGLPLIVCVNLFCLFEWAILKNFVVCFLIFH